MTSMNFIGLDIHKKTISYCVKDAAGEVLAEGTISATRQSLDEWMRTLRKPWTVAMEPSAERHRCATGDPDQPSARSPQRAFRPRVFS